MVVLFQKSVYPIAILLFALFCSCHSLPPSEPSEPLDTEKEIDPRELPWQEVSMPAYLLGDWYRQGEFHLKVSEDTLRVQGTWSLIQSIEKSDSYYRIIHKIAAQYYAMYFRKLTKNDVQVVSADSIAADEEGASALPIDKPWYNLTLGVIWVATVGPEDLVGNWHIQDGNMEISIDKESVVVDGESWSIEAIQNNHKIYRLILERSGAYNSLYFGNLSTYSMDAIMVYGREDIQDRYGNVPGEWNTLSRWWDFIEKNLWYQGSIWTYSYHFGGNYIRVNNTSSPIDSIAKAYILKGQLELEVLSSTIDGGTGSLTLQATFQIDVEEGRYYHALKDSIIQVLTDSSWLNNILKTEQYEIFLENDTLWFETQEGKVFFSSRKFQLNALINLRPFVYPLTFPREDFPEGRDILAMIQFSQERTLPPPQINRLTPEILTVWSGGWHRVVFGIFTENIANFVPGNGFDCIYYKYFGCDKRYWFGDEQYLNPYVKETEIVCWFTGFTPGSQVQGE